MTDSDLKALTFAALLAARVAELLADRAELDIWAEDRAELLDTDSEARIANAICADLATDADLRTTGCYDEDGQPSDEPLVTVAQARKLAKGHRDAVLAALLARG